MKFFLRWYSFYCYKAGMAKLTTRQAAEKLGISVRRINALIQTGQLPAEKFGPINMIDEEDLKSVEDRKPGRPPKAKAEASKASKKGGKN